MNRMQVSKLLSEMISMNKNLCPYFCHKLVPRLVKGSRFVIGINSDKPLPTRLLKTNLAMSFISCVQNSPSHMPRFFTNVGRLGCYNHLLSNMVCKTKTDLCSTFLASTMKIITLFFFT